MQQSLSTLKFIEKAKKIHGDKFDYSSVDYISSKLKVLIKCENGHEFLQTPNRHLLGDGCSYCSGKVRYTTETFVEKARKIHSNKYDYSSVVYVNNSTKVAIICPIHGEFLQAPGDHINQKSGCKLCSNTNIVSTVETFIEKARKIHGDEFDYSLVDYKNNKSKVLIKCSDGHEFLQTPNRHLSGDGCSQCSGKLSYGTEEFIKRAKEIHGDYYDYSKVIYQNTSKPVTIICPAHGKFTQIPSNHLAGSKCPVCAGKVISDTTSFIKAAKKIHGTKYDYSKSIFTGSKDKLSIICPDHGEFLQAPNMHVGKNKLQGCPTCGGTLKKTTEEFINTASLLHSSKYDYSKVVYVDSRTHVKIICPVHGKFLQTSNTHLTGKGCSKCSAGSSLLERKLENYFNTNLPNTTVITRDRKVLSKCGKSNQPLELDFYLPEHNLAIEVHGNFWHSEGSKGKSSEWSRTHIANKYLLCKERGVQLLQFYEDEILFKFDVVTNIIKQKIGLTSNRYYARKTQVVELDKNTAKDFLDKYHLQGKCTAKVFYGLIDKKLDEYSEDDILAVMGFSYTVSNRGSKANPNKWELVRFASVGSIVGGASKLVTHFITEHPECEEIISYSDNRISDGNLYDTLGFEISNLVTPSYYYITPNDPTKARYHKSRFKKSEQLKLFTEENGYTPFDNSLTEYENANRNNFFRIWDAGKIKWILT